MASVGQLVKEHQLPDISVRRDLASEVSLQNTVEKYLVFTKIFDGPTCRGELAPLRTAARSALVTVIATSQRRALDAAAVTLRPPLVTSM